MKKIENRKSKLGKTAISYCNGSLQFLTKPQNRNIVSSNCHSDICLSKFFITGFISQFTRMYTYSITLNLMKGSLEGRSLN